jgi:hypothetical protein
VPLVSLDVPPGVYRNGTDLQATGRWRDASLVRWSDGTMRPVKGWFPRLTMDDSAPRGALAWEDNSGDSWIVCGTADKLKVASASGTVYDITPSGLVAGDVSSTLKTGYGYGFYGVDFYGTERPDIGSRSEATTWAIDTWGEYIVACSSADGEIYEWDLDTAGTADPVANAPIGNLGLVVTDERFLFALGAGGNPRLVQWCDRENNTLWTPAATNEAGDLELQTSGQIMFGLRVRGQTLIVTDQDAHTATYQGPPFVYGFERVGTGCGAISRRSGAVVDAGAFWMGYSDFYAYQGGAVAPIACDVRDWVFGSLNTAQQSKVYAVSNVANSEIWWFFPDAASIENSRYVSYNFKEGHWAIGEISRTAGVDRGVFRDPIWFDADGVAYNHETGFNYDGARPYAETGPLQIANGDQVAVVTELIPDEKTQGDVHGVFKTRFHPNDVERDYGPYSMSNPTSVRFTGREVRMRVEGVQAVDWRVGVMRLDVKAGGRR